MISLLMTQVDEILSEISRRVAAGGDLQNEIASIKAIYKNSSVFEGLEYQEKQQQFFTEKFGNLSQSKFHYQLRLQTSADTEQWKINCLKIKNMLRFLCYHNWHR